MVKTLFLCCLFIANLLSAQNSDLLYCNQAVTITAERAVFYGKELYNAKTDLQKLVENEQSEDCKVAYSFIYNPLSLIGDYYSYESFEGGVFACGSPGSSASVRTVDVRSFEAVSLTELFTEKSIVSALKKDPWIIEQEQQSNSDFSKIKTLESFIDSINQQGSVMFESSSFAVLENSPQKHMLAVKFVGQQYIGFSHNQLFQLVLWLKPTADFEKELKQNTKFMLGTYKNGLTKSTNMITLQLHKKADFNNTLSLELKSFSHKRPKTGGPTKATANIAVSKDGKSETVELSVHGTEGEKDDKTYDEIEWGNYSIKLLDLQYNTSVSLKISESRE